MSKPLPEQAQVVIGGELRRYHDEPILLATGLSAALPRAGTATPHAPLGPGWIGHPAGGRVDSAFPGQGGQRGGPG